MLKTLDKIWCWHGWTIVKWPFGVLVLWAVLFLIYSINTVKDYDKKFVESVYGTGYKIIAIKDVRISLPHSDMIKNIN